MGYYQSISLKFNIFSLIILIAELSNAQSSFTEVSREAGINHYFEVDLATFGGGAAVLDFNNDGYEDLYITGGKANDALYKNNGDGTFTNIIEGIGFERVKSVHTQGVSAADINRDGFIDIIVTTMNHHDKNRTLAPNLLFLNNGNGTFTDVTEKWGLEEYRSNSQGASFGDINADGYPDLYVANYYGSGAKGITTYNEATITNSFDAAIDFLFINDDGQRFLEVGEKFGLDKTGFSFEGLFTDFDNDGDLDLYVANDFGQKMTPNLLLRNNFPEIGFTEMSVELSMNYGMNAMGFASCDFNFDGWMDYYVTNIGPGLFTENQYVGNKFKNLTPVNGVGISLITDENYTGPPISWGTNFFDYDHDMDMDLFVNNGALNPTVRRNPNFLFENENGKYNEIAKSLNLNDYQIGRGSVVFDYDNDGDLDLFVVNQKPREPSRALPDPRCTLYRNETGNGNWIKVKLEGSQSDLNGIGSRIELKIGNKLLVREIYGGSSHLSMNSTIAHFGLKDENKIDTLTVKWMGGTIQTLTTVGVNQLLVVKEETQLTLWEKLIILIYMVMQGAIHLP